ncbi:MAG: isochorismatase family protein [Woeseiaceae bacterium]|nr:isochorismatase family protein [Woeseiaceae bacterium]
MNRFSIDDSMMALIDHQTGTNQWGVTTPLEKLERNVLALAEFAAGVGIPVVLTSSQETNVQGPLMPQLAELLPESFEKRIQRSGIVNAWDQEEFVRACKDTNRKNIVMAGVTTEVCVVSPAVSALDDGFNVKVVVDACGSPNQVSEEIAWRRLEQGGVGLTSLNAIVSELARNWSTPNGQIAQTVLHATLE